MQIILDTNIVIYGILVNDEHPDCWEILNRIRKKELTPIVSEALVREYIFAPFSALTDGMKENLRNKELTENMLDEYRDSFYDYAKVVSKLIMTNATNIEVVSNCVKGTGLLTTLLNS